MRTWQQKKQLQNARYRLQRKLNGEKPAPEWIQGYCNLLCDRANVKRVDVTVKYNNYPNASMYFCDNHISLATYDLTHLSALDIKALLAHEIGHIKLRHVVRYPKNNCVLIACLCALGAIITMATAENIKQAAKSMYWLHVGDWLYALTYLFIIAVIGFGVWQKKKNLQLRQNAEQEADVYGAYLLGMPAMINLMQDMIKFEQSEKLEIVRISRELILTPTAFLKCCWLLFLYIGMDFLRSHGWWVYPSFDSRIDNLKKNTGKEVMACRNVVSKRN